MLSTKPVGAALPPVCTPLLVEGGVRLKAEGAQTTGSVKYRMVYAKLRAALLAGHVKPGMTLTEVSSGSTGVALASVGRMLGLPVVIHAYEDIDPFKRAAIRAADAVLLLHPRTVSVPDLLRKVHEPGDLASTWHLNQYDRRTARLAYRELALECVRQWRESCGEPPDAFVCPVGTGGVIQGVGSELRRTFPGLAIVAVEPEPGAHIDGTRNTELHHGGAEDPYERSFPDRRVTVPAPATRAVAGGVRLGWSGTAAFEVARTGGWKRPLVISPD